MNQLEKTRIFLVKNVVRFLVLPANVFICQTIGLKKATCFSDCDWPVFVDKLISLTLVYLSHDTAVFSPNIINIDFSWEDLRAFLDVNMR